MLQQIATSADPIVYFAVLFPLSLAVLYLGYRYAARAGAHADEKAGWAFSVGQAAIFGLIALIIGFSFSFAVGKFETRRALVVNESDAIRAAYLRAGFLPAPRAQLFRKILLDYTNARLQAYAAVHDPPAERGLQQRGDALQRRMWLMAAGSARRDPRSPFIVDLSRSVIEIIAVAEAQEAALTNHVPLAVIGIVLLCTLIGAFLIGLTFGRARTPHVMLSILFCLLFGATVATIIDLDHPQGGFISLDVAPLQATLRDMTTALGSSLIPPV
ncbi:MAG: hypothetical protein JO263_04385 [Candidatus Eremiobacteraeota bacterium]|nr:hypothetical protein [Candidatus Eremiobacteraeota bacterium]